MASFGGLGSTWNEIKEKKSLVRFSSHHFFISRTYFLVTFPISNIKMEHRFGCEIFAVPTTRIK